MAHSNWERRKFKKDCLHRHGQGVGKTMDGAALGSSNGEKPSPSLPGESKKRG